MSTAEYPPECVTWALEAIVVAGGNVADAHRNLQDRGGFTDDDGFNHGTPSVRVLRDWKNDQHTERYRQLEATYTGELETQLVAYARENAQKASDATRKLVDQVLDDIKNDRLKGREAAQAALALAKVTGQSVTDILRLTNRPVDGSGTETQDAVAWLVDMGLIRPIAPAGPAAPSQLEPAIPGEADEIADVEPVGGPA